jgi:hypothetical protein
MSPICSNDFNGCQPLTATPCNMRATSKEGCCDGLSVSLLLPCVARIANSLGNGNSATLLTIRELTGDATDQWPPFRYPAAMPRAGGRSGTPRSSASQTRASINLARFTSPRGDHQRRRVERRLMGHCNIFPRILIAIHTHSGPEITFARWARRQSGLRP